MRRLQPHLLWLLVLLPAPGLALAGETSTPAAAPPATKTEVQVTGRYEVRDGQRMLTLWGTPRERGFAQGYLLAEEILDGVTHDFQHIMNAQFRQLYNALVTKVVVPRFTFSDRELAEIEGLFAGVKARLPAERLQLEALGRPFELIDLKALNTFGDWYGLGCSSLAAWGELTKDGKLLVGRNFDFPAFDLVLKHQYVFVRAPDGDLPGQVGVTYPGCIGTLTGMNVHGVFVAIHDVRVKPTLDKALRRNVPRLLAVRRLLEQTEGADACTAARDLVRTWPTLYGNNLMVAAPRRKDGAPCAAVLEYDWRSEVDAGCTMRIADAASELPKDAPPAVCLACTNHHRCREEPAGYVELFPRWRYEALSAVKTETKPDKPLDVAGMFGWMARAAFPQGGKVQESATSLYGEERHHGTLHEVVAEPEAARLHVKLGAVGKHIKDVEARAYDVPALIRGAVPAK